MLRQPAAWGPPLRAEVDLEFCRQAQALYRGHGVWTWPDAWDFWPEDSFVPLLPGTGPVPARAVRWVRGPFDDDYPAHAAERAAFDGIG
jgi:hypothetical protein